MPANSSATRAALADAAAEPAVVPAPALPDDSENRVAGLDALETVADNRASRGRRIWKATWPKLLAVFIVLAVWQIVVWAKIKPEFVLPGPSTVFSDLKDLIVTGDFWQGVRVTMTRAVVGFLCAVVIGTVVGAAVSRFAPLRAAIGSLITGLQTMPSIMWFPLAILLFQLSEKAILFVVIIGAAPSVANGLISGIDYVPRVWLRVGQVLGMKGFAKYRYLIIPAALPSFVSGLKQGWAFSWRSLMAGELLVIVPGALSIGVRMQQARDLNEASLVICYIIVVLVIGILVDVLFSTADRGLRKRWGLTGN
jgi:NitT/TauT family transport system permease protein